MAVCTQYSHSKYEMMSFKFSNIPTSFQGYINKILAKKLDIFIIIYLDNIFIYTEDPDQNHVIGVHQVLDILRKNSFFANFKKCYFHKDEICFLSYIILIQKIKIEDKRIEAIKNWPESKSISNI